MKSTYFLSLPLFFLTMSCKPADASPQLESGKEHPNHTRTLSSRFTPVLDEAPFKEDEEDNLAHCNGEVIYPIPFNHPDRPASTPALDRKRRSRLVTVSDPVTPTTPESPLIFSRRTSPSDERKDAHQRSFSPSTLLRSECTKALVLLQEISPTQYTFNDIALCGDDQKELSTLLGILKNYINERQTAHASKKNQTARVHFNPALIEHHEIPHRDDDPHINDKSYASADYEEFQRHFHFPALFQDALNYWKEESNADLELFFEGFSEKATPEILLLHKLSITRPTGLTLSECQRLSYLINELTKESYQTDDENSGTNNE